MSVEVTPPSAGKIRKGRSLGSATVVAAEAELVTLSIGIVVVGSSGSVIVEGNVVVVGTVDKSSDVCVRKEN